MTNFTADLLVKHIVLLRSMYCSVRSMQYLHRVLYKCLHGIVWHAGLEYLTIAALPQDLQRLLPDLPIHSPSKTQLVRALAADTCTTASRLLQLKSWFPSANISIMVAHRSHML